MQAGERVFIFILFAALIALLVYEHKRGAEAGSVQQSPAPSEESIARETVGASDVDPYLAAPPLMAMLPTIAGD